MKPAPALKLGDLDLQVTFTLYDKETRYRTITYPQRPANKYWGSRACLNLTTNKAENLLCGKPVILVQ